MAELRIKMTSVADIRPYPGNPRRNEKAVDAVAASIREFGFLNPVVLDEENVVLCGHTRLLAALKMALVEIPTVTVKGLTDEQKRAYRLVDNRVAEIAVWDMDALKKELAEIKDMFDMTQFGFKADNEALARDLSEKKHRCPKCGYEW